MKSMSHVAIAAALGVMFLCVPANADGEESAAELKEVRDGQAALQSEMAELRKEIAAMRKDMQQILVQLKTIKAQGANKAKPQARRRPALDLLGKEAPKHTFKTHQGSDVTIGGQSDKVTVAFFYASWCGFCKRSLPGIQKIHETYGEKGVEVVAINLDDRTGRRAKTAEDSIKHYDSMNLSIPLFLDGKKEVGRPYKVSSFPTSFVLGKNGKIEAVHIGGPVDLDKQIMAELDQLLAGKSLLKAEKPEEKKDKKTAAKPKA